MINDTQRMAAAENQLTQAQRTLGEIEQALAEAQQQLRQLEGQARANLEAVPISRLFTEADKLARAQAGIAGAETAVRELERRRETASVEVEKARAEVHRLQGEGIRRDALAMADGLRGNYQALLEQFKMYQEMANKFQQLTGLTRQWPLYPNHLNDLEKALRSIEEFNKNHGGA